MLVTYHRTYDAKLLLLSIPACALLWVEGGLIGWLAVIVTGAGIVMTGDIFLVGFLRLTSKMTVEATGMAGKILTVLLTRPASLALLVMAVFFVWGRTRGARLRPAG